MGFGIPIDTWIKSDLRDWAETLLNEKSLENLGYFNVPLIRKQWEEHLAGRNNRYKSLWNVLMFQAWLMAHAN